MFTYWQWVGIRDKFDHRVGLPVQDEKMNSHVAWMLELQVQDGRENDFRALMTEMVSATDANEPGALNYEWSTSPDGKQCHLSWCTAHQTQRCEAPWPASTQSTWSQPLAFAVRTGSQRSVVVV